MNIILNEDCTLRTTKMSQSETYDLSEIFFFIPNAFNCCNVFVALTNSMGLTDIVPLNFIENSQSYKKYKLTYANSIRIDSGKIEIKLILVNMKNQGISISSGDKLYCNITIENYKIAHQVAISNELNSSIKELYEKIRQLTEMNIEIYKKIAEVNKN